MVKKKYSRDGRAPIPKSEVTSRVMSSNKAKNTKPELLIRKRLWEQGLKGYRLHCKNIPGNPDIAYISKKIAIFIHGCFWHGHNKCHDGHIPKSNREYWKTKIEKNIKRDKNHNKKLKSLGWKILTLWECDIKKSNNPIKEIVYNFEVVEKS